MYTHTHIIIFINKYGITDYYSIHFRTYLYIIQNDATWYNTFLRSHIMMLTSWWRMKGMQTAYCKREPSGMWLWFLLWLLLLLVASLSLNSMVFIAAITSIASRNFEAGTFEASSNQLKRYSSSSRIHTCHTLFSKWGFGLPSCPRDSCIQVNDPHRCVWNVLSDHSSCRFYIGFLIAALWSAHVPTSKGVLELWNLLIRLC